jgi:hypothetical protein
MSVDSKEVKAKSRRLCSCSKRLRNPGEVTHAGRVAAEPDVGRGAALSDGSSIGWQRAAPENYPAIAFAQAAASAYYDPLRQNVQPLAKLLSENNFPIKGYS